MLGMLQMQLDRNPSPGNDLVGLHSLLSCRGIVVEVSMSQLTSRIVTAALIAAMTLSGVLPVAPCAAHEADSAVESHACCCSGMKESPRACCIPKSRAAACGCSARRDVPADPSQTKAPASNSKPEVRYVSRANSDGAESSIAAFAPAASHAASSVALDASHRQALLGCWQI